MLGKALLFTTTLGVCCLVSIQERAILNLSNSWPNRSYKDNSELLVSELELDEASHNTSNDPGLPTSNSNASVFTTTEKAREIVPSKNSERTSTLRNLLGESDNPVFHNSREKLTHGRHVIMSFYHGTYGTDRFEEVIFALKQNLANPHVTAVHALWEDHDPITYLDNESLVTERYKLIRVAFGKQPTYKDLFDYANLRLGRGAVGIVTNADIFFDETLACVVPVSEDKPAFNATKQHVVYALSRHPAPPTARADIPGSQSCLGQTDFCDVYLGSHDAFMFALPLPDDFASKLDFTQNNIGAENIVIWEFRRLEGYIVKNPCSTVRAFHIHCSPERQYRKYSISRGRHRIGNVDRHSGIYPTLSRCGQVMY